MGTDKPIPLRGHHLRNIGAIYFIADYSRYRKLSPFETKAYSFLEGLIQKPEQKVTLVDDSDSICTMCRSIKRPGEATCFSEDVSEEGVTEGDKHVAELIGLKLGQTYSMQEILEAIDKNKTNWDFLPIKRVAWKAI